MQFDPQKTVFLIDGSSFLYRAYYSLKPLSSSKGLPVQAVFGFCRMLKKIINDFNPQYLGIIWDSKGKTVRHELYADYKATRQEPPSDLFIQKELIQQFASLIQITQCQKTGVEADDLMYSIAQELKDQASIVLITSDKDMGQALNGSTFIFDPFKNEYKDREKFEMAMGFAVNKLPFYYALVGDSSDNIPGVKGIGPKGATDLVKKFDSLEDLYRSLEQVTKEKTRELLTLNKDNAFLSEKLFKLHYVPLNTSKDFWKFDATQWKNALPFFQDLNFKTLAQELEEKTSQEKVPQLLASHYSFKCITTKNQLEELAVAIKSKRLIALDTEGSGLLPLRGAMCGFSVCLEKGVAYYIPFAHTSGENQLSFDTICEIIKPLLEDETIKKVMHHAKFDLLVFAQADIQIRGLVFDTLVAAHLLNQDGQKIGLKYLSQQYLNEPMLSYANVVTDNKYHDFTEVPLAPATEYAAADAHQTLQLVPLLQEGLDTMAMSALYHEIELPLVPILGAIEKEGIIVDTEILKKMGIQATYELERLKETIITLIGQTHATINLNSPKQLEELLFHHLKLPPQKKTSGKTGYSTDQEVLQTLAKIHPVPALIAQYRELFKLKSTYIDALPDALNPETGRIHTTLSQTLVTTGRLSSSEPNLQNIPTFNPNYPDIQIRKAFKAPAGHLFLSADYSQIELRILAEFSADTHLIETFLHGGDIHQKTAANIFNVPLNVVTPKQRQIGKRINFSILYGLTAYGLSKDIDISVSDAKKYIDTYFQQYPGVQQWMDETIQQTKLNGYTKTYWGRRRYLPGIYEKNKVLFDVARRMAINTPVQGTAAELMKRGMIELHKKLTNHHLNARMVMQIHDELILAVPEKEIDRTQQIVKESLEHVVKWRIPLSISTRTGLNWHEVSK